MPDEKDLKELITCMSKLSTDTTDFFTKQMNETRVLFGRSLEEVSQHTCSYITTTIHRMLEATANSMDGTSKVNK